MPTFYLRKLVRDKLLAAYSDMDQQYDARQLTGKDLQQALVAKLKEESDELAVSELSKDDAVSELADILQVIDDLCTAMDIDKKVVLQLQKTKFEKKGGFTGGNYVETLTLSDDDEWVAYYRKKPDVFPEVKE